MWLLGELISCYAHEQRNILRVTQDGSYVFHVKRLMNYWILAPCQDSNPGSSHFYPNLYSDHIISDASLSEE